MNLSVELAPQHKQGLTLKNPVMVASGTFSYGLELRKVFDIDRLGAIVSKGTTAQPRRGNPQPRVTETPAGMLNSIGLQNVGVETVIRDFAPIWATWAVPVIVNIAAESVYAFAALAARLDDVPGVAGLELNISCPNVAHGLDFGQSPDLAAAVTSAVKRETTLPVIVKLTPNVTDPALIARAVAEAGADAISCINTVQALAIDVRRRRPDIATIVAGLSGPAIKPIALRVVWEVASAVAIPVIGIGGISTAWDALEFLMAGATAVQVGTATFRNPLAPLQVLEGLEQFMAAEGIKDIRTLIGAARVAP